MNTNIANGIAANLAQLQAQADTLRSVLPQAPYDGPEPMGAAPSATGFGERMRQAIDGVNRQDHAAGQLMAAVDSGQSDDLVGAMLSSQQASLSFSMLMQVRNKVVTAVEDLVKLPI